MENEVLKALAWDGAAGKLAYKGVRYLLIRPETLAGFQKALEKEIGERAGECIFAGGFTGGSLSSRRYRQGAGIGDEETARFMCRMGGEIGWGHFDLRVFDARARRLVVAVTGSPFAEAYGCSDKPVCHFIRGVLAGVGDTLFGDPVVALETACRARGDTMCWFEVEHRAEGS